MEGLTGDNAFNIAMENAYLVIAGKTTVSKILNKDPEHVLIAFNPYKVTKEEMIKTINNLIDHYTEREEYEKCTKLLKIKKRLV